MRAGNVRTRAIRGRLTTASLGGVLVLVLTLLATTLPASATVNGGPWDVSTLYFNTCGFLTSGVCNNNSNGAERGLAWVTVDSDDYAAYSDASPEYFACYQLVGRSSSPGTVYGSVAFKKTATASGGSTPSPSTQSGYLFATWYGGMFGGDYDVTGLRVASSSTCGASQFSSSTGVLALRAYSGTVYDPNTNRIRNDGDALNTSGSSPFFSSSDSATTRPPTIATSGGSVLPAQTVPTPTCDRTLTDTSAMVGQFTAAAAIPSAEVTNGVTATQGVWAWGDGTSNTTLSGAGAYVQNHTYPAIGSQPTGGWTATVTVSYVISGGNTFVGGGSTATATCQLRVDFLNPSLKTPGSTSTGGTTGDSNLDSCLPSGWSTLNPLAWIGGLGCVLKVLFVPTARTTSQFTSLQSDWSGSVLGTTTVPLTAVFDSWGQIKSGWDYEISTASWGAQCAGPTFDVPLDPMSPSNPAHVHQVVSPLSTCDTAHGGNDGIANLASDLHAALTVLVYFGAAYMAYRLLAGALGLHVDVGGGEGEG